MSISNRRIGIRYGLAIVSVAVVALVQWMLQPALADAAPLILFVLPIVAAGWYGTNGALVGLWSSWLVTDPRGAALATVIGALGVAWLLDALVVPLGDAPLGEGHIADINLEAGHWIRRIAASLDRGYHLAIDYGYLRDEFYAQPRGTLMCYWHHLAVEDPYLRIGEQDITAHVNFSDLIEEGTNASLETVRFTTQMDYLIGLGILDEIAKLANAGDAASMARLVKVKNLILPGSMGERFKVLVQTKR